jgi:hypothetical protein
VNAYVACIPGNQNLHFCIVCRNIFLSYLTREAQFWIFQSNYKTPIGIGPPITQKGIKLKLIYNRIFWKKLGLVNINNLLILYPISCGILYAESAVYPVQNLIYFRSIYNPSKAESTKLKCFVIGCRKQKWSVFDGLFL